MSEIDNLIHRLDVWLQENRPGYYGTLNPGATEQGIQSLEERLGWKLPDDLATFYRWKAGTSHVEVENDRYGFIYFWDILDFSDIAEEKSYISNPKLLPFATDGSGSFLLLDSSGYETGVLFQVLNLVKGDIGNITNSSFKLWLKAQLYLMESGAFEAWAEGDDATYWRQKEQMPDFDPGFSRDFDVYEILEG